MIDKKSVKAAEKTAKKSAKATVKAAKKVDAPASKLKVSVKAKGAPAAVKSVLKNIAK
jgi:hypothetical protein